jgi:short-subunit dehydrogenase
MSTDRNWAVITGASSGIGKALAFEFAAGGFNLLLTGRNAKALNNVATECSTKHHAETEVVTADLSCTESVDSLIDAILSKPRRYEVLVNNAGFGIHGDFASTDVEENIKLLNVQLTAALKLTQAVLSAMKARRSGKILNVGSVYSFAPVPFQSVYAACKAFLLSFSASLQSELTDTGVTVTVFCPGITQTEFRSRAGIREKSKSSGMTADSAAHIAFVETMRGKHIVIPGFANRAFTTLTGVLSPTAMANLVRFINRLRGQ